MGEPIPFHKPRPPIGVLPRKIWLEQRKESIESAIIRYTLDDKQVPREWIDELRLIYVELNIK